MSNYERHWCWIDTIVPALLLAVIFTVAIGLAVCVPVTVKGASVCF